MITRKQIALLEELVLEVLPSQEKQEAVKAALEDCKKNLLPEPTKGEKLFEIIRGKRHYIEDLMLRSVQWQELNQLQKDVYEIMADEITARFQGVSES